MYQFSDDFNKTARFWFEKKLIKNKNWAILPKASKAIFPVIACHVNESGKAFPSERTIAILSGVSDKVVRQGIKGLEGFYGFKWRPYTTIHGRRSKKFYLNLPVRNISNAFPFFRVILEYGLWRELISTAKSLYPVMRYYGFFDIDQYAELEGIEIEDFSEEYRQRRYDFCNASNESLCEYAGIHRASAYTALNSLEKNFLIEPIYNGWKVFSRGSGTHWKRAFLNKKIQKSYGYIL